MDFCENIKKRKLDYILEIGNENGNDGNNTNEKSDKNGKKSEEYYNESSSDKAEVKSYKNHIYFYCGVSKKTCLQLNMELKEIAQGIVNNGQNHIDKNKFIYIHINSFGGSVFAALSVIDTIKSLPIPTVSIIEGGAASAATMISVSCTYRIMRENSFMLIHQLSSSCWGKMNDLEEEMQNLKKLMKKIKSIYKTHTKLQESELGEILKHDFWWDCKKCLSSGLVDEIKEPVELIYPIDPSLLKC